LLVESERSAASRRARIYGEVIGVGASGSRATVNAWSPDPDGIARSMQNALLPSATVADDVVAVFATSNGSPDLDVTESAAIDGVFKRPVPVVSLKGAVGESSASGAASIVAALIAGGEGRLPPTVGWQERDPACPVAVSARVREIPRGVFVVNAVGSGGTNYSAALRVERSPDSRL
jgi:3-oxoacyl-(acyl-carrier-protein) synthase